MNKQSKIPDPTPELKQRLLDNTESLISLGVKEWMKKRKKKSNMDEMDQKETVRKISEELKDG